MSEDHSKLQALLDDGYQIPIVRENTTLLACKYEDCYAMGGEIVGSPRFVAWCVSASIRFIDPKMRITFHIKKINQD